MTQELPPVNAPDMEIALALFGQALKDAPKALDLVNTFGPLLMASALFSMSQDWAPDDAHPDGYVARRNLEEARDQCIKVIQAVYRGMELHADGDGMVDLADPSQHPGP